ncbi:MAG: sigma-54 interaction domain-containing protein [Alphaproteobacteria bacterium]
MARGGKTTKGPGAQTLTRDQLAGLGLQRLASLLLEEAVHNQALFDLLNEAVKTEAGRPTALGGESAGGEAHMVGASRAMISMFESIRRFANTDAPVLITGESGTGKELAALALHERSPYSRGPFAPINCAGIPPTLIASELFGHEKGSFTGAYQRKIGRIEAAAGGTVFLDEIGDLPLELQTHLLRFLQEKTIDRVGGNRPIRVDVRVIAATNSDLRKAMTDGRFREDLYYRLNVLRLEMPPLRDRGEDIELVAMYFLRKFADEMHRAIRGFDDKALETLRAYRWPGNVRELISCVRRAVVIADGELITVGDLGLAEPAPAPVSESAREEPGWTGAPGGGFLGGKRRPERPPPRTPEGRAPSLKNARRELESVIIREALQRNGNNVKRTALELGLSRVTLYRLMEKHGIEPH